MNFQRINIFKYYPKNEVRFLNYGQVVGVPLKKKNY